MTSCTCRTPLRVLLLTQLLSTVMTTLLNFYRPSIENLPASSIRYYSCIPNNRLIPETAQHSQYVDEEKDNLSRIHFASYSVRCMKQCLDNQICVYNMQIL